MEWEDVKKHYKQGLDAQLIAKKIQAHFTKLHITITAICGQEGIDNSIRKELHTALEECEEKVNIFR